ncbi:MAG: HDOD domain-containing protein [Spartobacteria bacterium]|nr:HDOD domain-containing protein [Spartobacteria bacterium]
MINVEPDEIKQKLLAEEEVACRSYVMDEDNVDRVVSIMEIALDVGGKKIILDELGYCLRELLDNAQKANIKRAYFLREQLDLNNPEDYEQGMEGFADQAFSTAEFRETLKEQNWFVEVGFLLTSTLLTIRVTNSAPILEKERQRIMQKIIKAKVYNSLDEVFDDISDESESAGLGIVMLIIMLRKLGVPDDGFSIAADDGQTHARLLIPLHAVSDEESEEITDELIGEISSIPQFPESIISLTRMINDPACDFQKISRHVKRDPGLMMEVLRTANSAQYRRLNKIENSDLAISILGTKGLRFILQSYGAKRALEQKFDASVLDELWAHSVELAEICSVLCVRYKIHGEDADITYLGALLHDIGKIVLQGRNPDTYDALHKLCARKNLSAGAVENLIEGVNHAVLGARMAENWNLSERIVGIIRSCPVPLSADEDIRKICKIIYLAHMVYYHQHSQAREYEVDEHILEEFGLSRGETLNELVEYCNTQL